MINIAMDWTEEQDQKEIAQRAGRMIDAIIASFHGMEIRAFSRLSVKELALLCRFPVHVATNQFIERLLRINFAREHGRYQSYPSVPDQTKYFRNTHESVVSYYYDYSINYNLLGELKRIISGKTTVADINKMKLLKPQGLLIGRKGFNLKAILRQIRQRFDKAYVVRLKPGVIGDRSNWMEEILRPENLFHFDYDPGNRQEDKLARICVRGCCSEVFHNRIDEIIAGLTEQQKTELADLFAKYIDRILPLSVIENLELRFKHYEKLLKGWSVREVHSFTGYYYNENFKVFAILAKRKNALLIGHQHGASNMLSSRKQASNELAFLDYYFTWGKNNSDWLKDDVELPRLKIFNCGSTYLNAIPKMGKSIINQERMTILYPSGPLMKFVADLEEISPEKNRAHRLRVLQYLKELRQRYPGIKILYKPFPGTFENDPIKKVFARELKEKIVEVVDQKPLNYYHQAGIVLWDTIGTGFAESVQSGAPTIVFHNEWEQQHATARGKEIDRELVDAGIAFYEIEAGLKAFDWAVNDPEGYSAIGKEAIKKFQAEVAWPVMVDEVAKQLDLLSSMRKQQEEESNEPTIF